MPPAPFVSNNGVSTVPALLKRFNYFHLLFYSVYHFSTQDLGKKLVFQKYFDYIPKKLFYIGETVRGLKSKKADKASVDKEVKTLLELKKRFKELSGQDYTPELAQKLSTKSVVADSTVAEPKGSSDSAMAQLNKACCRL